MTNDTTLPNHDDNPAQDTAGAYELIRARLNQQSQTLGQQLQQLNQQRVDLFGSTQMAVIGQTRLRTENNCVPRDILDIGDHLLFGYNVFVGMKTETAVADVFSLQDIRETEQGLEFSPVDAAHSLLSNPQFIEQFHELYRYYKQARLLQLRNVNNLKLAVFQIGRTLKDVKVFRWAEQKGGGLKYLDNRGERDNIYPPSHDIDWIATSREQHVTGKHPHISILDQVFVETVGGSLTIKIENNTEDGLGIYNEPVDDPNQSLADAQIFYAVLGTLILLKIRPYREEIFRYLVFNTVTEAITRIDAIDQGCIQLPENHGFIFPGGYYLKNGETRIFEGEDLQDMRFLKQVKSPNGEDVLYVFYQDELGKMVLFSYNLIRREVQTPIICHGHCLFRDGRMVVFRADDDTPAKVHPVQIWQTPYTSEEFAAQQPKASSPLARIGNPDLVRGISDAYNIKRLLDDAQPNMAIYEQLVAAIQRAFDSYHWLAHAEVGDLAAQFRAILGNVELIRDEFEKVQTLRREAAHAIDAAETRQQALLSDLKQRSNWQNIADYVKRLSDLRQQRGQLITLRELRYMDVARIDALEQETIEHFNQLSQDTVAFLLDADALQPYHQQLDQQLNHLDTLKTSQDLPPVREALTDTGTGLDLLSEVLNDLQIEDTNVRTRILEDIAEVYGKLNRARAELNLKQRELASHEAKAEFGAQFKLFSQSVSAAMNMVDTPNAADEQLSRLLMQLEDLEARFSEFDEYLLQIADKRDEVYNSFETRKQVLLEERQRRSMNLSQAAERIIDGIARRVANFATPDQQNAYFASDAMVLKVRDIVRQLTELGETVRAGDIEGKLKAARDRATRELRDRQDLFSGGGATIQLGKHQFSVNTQDLDLSLVPQELGDGETAMAVHLSGTDYFEIIEDEALNAAKAYWSQTLVSENNAVYRAEFLAWQVWQQQDLTAVSNAESLAQAVRQFAAERYEEGYERGVHDHDAALIVEQLLQLSASAGALRYNAPSRAAAQLFWVHEAETPAAQFWRSSAQSLQQLRHIFGQGWQDLAQRLTQELQAAVMAFLTEQQLNLPNTNQAGAYLLHELQQDPLSFTVAEAHRQLASQFAQQLNERGQWAGFNQTLSTLEGQLSAQFALISAWLQGFAVETTAAALLETAAIVLAERHAMSFTASAARTAVQLNGLLGQHQRVLQRQLDLQLDEFIARLQQYEQVQVPAYRAWRKTRQQIIERERKVLRLNEFKPRPLTTFVRNKLINEVYLPLIGDNFAKQLSTVGEQKRTDLMGLLLLISPPGYGKTTLIEYLAQRLGLIFVKVNCPTVGHQVISLDPQEAPNATARQELIKLNLALEMGNNVMLYLDDIQHSNPEFLQKFISLADGQRRIEGIWRGQSRTYDLRGKRFAIVMAGNPYTESGEAFKIPDMLANRADIYNLGDVLSGREAAFALSYIENSLTSNPVLAPLATRDPADVYRLLRLAHGEEVNSSEFAHSYSATELNEITAVLRKLTRVQQVLLKVNQQYIYSAAQDDRYRTEPPFRLQGSYRNMNKLAEKVVAVMNTQELENLIADHYQGEAQTLTTGAEENLLKFAELRDAMTAAQQARWAQVKSTFNRLQSVGSEDADPVTRVVSQLSGLSQQLQAIQQAISHYSQQLPQQQEQVVAVNHLVKVLSNLSTPLENIQQSLLRAAQAQVNSTQENTRELSRHLSALPELAQQLASLKTMADAPDWAPAVKQMIDLIESSLLPLAQNFERKSRLDLVIWHRLKDVLDTLKELDKGAFNRARLANRGERE